MKNIFWGGAQINKSLKEAAELNRDLLLNNSNQ